MIFLYFEVLWMYMPIKISHIKVTDIRLKSNKQKTIYALELSWDFLWKYLYDSARKNNNS